jgi:uncharacterized protein (TIRG00374 family)
VDPGCPISTSNDRNLLVRFRRWVVGAIVAGVLVYVGVSVWAGFEETANELRAFTWWLMVPVLALTLVNYGLRFLKWDFLLKRLGYRVPLWDNLTIYLAGLAMVISPFKAGELLKPFLISRKTGASMATTLPALVSERLTDAMAVLILAGISVGTYAERLDGTSVFGIQVTSQGALAVVAGAIVLGLIVVASKTVSMFCIDVLAKIPWLGPKLAPKLREMYGALRTTLGPVPLLYTLVLSLIAWGAECVGFLLVLRGFDVLHATLDGSTFIYAFATVAGGPSPGGLGIADGALVGMTTKIVGTSEAVAVASALLIRVATLWFGVILGAFALLRFESLLQDGIVRDEE